MQVPTRGLLNTIGAPHLGGHSPYFALNTSLATDPLPNPTVTASIAATRKLHWVSSTACIAAH